ncbi:MAG: hypothetical protein ACNA8N_04905 [Trueperaceae bacterium]
MTLAIGRPHTVDSDLAVAALTYIAERQTRPTLHSVFKVPYDAEKRHLTEYLQPIVGDRYVAMDFGPIRGGSSSEAVEDTPGSRSADPWLTVLSPDGRPTSKALLVVEGPCP